MNIYPAHTEIGFKVKHLMFTNVRGSFKKFDACIYTTGKDFMSITEAMSKLERNEYNLKLEEKLHVFIVLNYMTGLCRKILRWTNLITSEKN
jgi:hypothetical protein